MKQQTVYTVAQYMISAEEIVESLRLLGLGRGAIADECRKIAAAGGPRASVFRKAAALAKSILREDRQCTPNQPQECAALGGAR